MPKHKLFTMYKNAVYGHLYGHLYGSAHCYHVAWLLGLELNTLGIKRPRYMAAMSRRVNLKV